MLNQSLMRRGVSLEVILEEDDNSEVSFNPISFQEESDSNSSSPTPPAGHTESPQGEGHKAKEGPFTSSDRLREEKRKRRREADGELWTRLDKQRSLSCETLTILDVGDDEFSRELWEEEAREWGDLAEDTTRNSQIEHSISRRKILLQAASRTSTGFQDGDPYHNMETEKQEADLETYTYDHVAQKENCQNEGVGGKKRVNLNLMEGHTNEQDLKSVPPGEREDGDGEIPPHMPPKADGISVTSAPYDESEPLPGRNLICNRFPDRGMFDPLHQESLTAEEDSWIAVGDLENSFSLDNGGHSHDDSTVVARLAGEVETDGDRREREKGEEDGGRLEEHKEEREEEQTRLHYKPKGVRFREEPEYVSERAELVFIDDSFEKEDASAEIVPDKGNQHCHSSPQEVPHHLINVRMGRELFEMGSKEGRTESPAIYDDRCLPDALENTDILIVEKPALNPNQYDAQENAISAGFLRVETEVPSSPLSSSGSSSCNAHNSEVHPEELPPPHTVASVKQLFEHMPSTATFPSGVMHLNFQSRFDHVRSNPSSKIFRFDRDWWTSSYSPHSLRRRSPAAPPSYFQMNFKEGGDRSTPSKTGRYSPSSRPGEDYCSTGVHLRKPRVARGFDVRKALRENPRYFHIRLGERSKEWEVEKAPTATKTTTGKGAKITYSYVEAKHHSQRGTTTTLRWTKETIDPSDAESMSSESSEDSGVTKDFSSSSIITSFSESASRSKKSMRWKCPDLMNKQFASDPSFKWIDPAVLARIRARGTTVIYFGPRRRPGAGTGPSYFKAPPRPNPALKGTAPDGDRDATGTLTGIGEREDKNETEMGRGEVLKHAAGHQHPQNTIQVTYEKNILTLAESPKIVGVKHKRAPLFPHSRQAAAGADREMPPRLKPFPHRDSIFLPKRDSKNKSPGNNSTVYDFTQKPA